MATTIVTKNNASAGVAPSAGQLVQGELAVNVTDKRLYTLNAANQVVLLSSGSDYVVPVTIIVSGSTAAVTVTQSGSGGAAVFNNSGSGNSVRITNTGTGNSLLVEDSANPDSTPFVIDSSGNVGVGTSSPTAQLTVSSAAATVDVARLYSGVDGAVQSETGIGFNPGTGSVNPAARISALELDASDSRASLLFYTRDTNSDVAPTERLRITSTGALAVAGAANYGTAGQALISAGNAAPVWTDQFLSITYIFSSIAAGDQGDLTIPFGCTITEWTLLADISGSIVIDIWKDTYANYPPTVLDTITGSAKPTITTALKGQSSTLTGWTATINAGDTLRFNVDSVTTISRVTLSLKVKRT